MQKQKTIFEMPAESARPKPIENLPRQDVAASIEEEEEATLEQLLFLDLLRAEKKEKLLRYLERMDYDMAHGLNERGEYKFVRVTDRNGKEVFFVDFEWYRKMEELESRKTGWLKERRQTKENENLLPEILKKGGTKVITVQPETDPNKIN